MLRRVRQGAYCFGDVWAILDPEERHLLMARAVLRTTPGPVALSHTTALLLHGIDVWGADLSKVHVTRLDDGSCRAQRDVEHHVGLCLEEDDVTHVDGLPVVVPDRAVVESATQLSVESGLVSANCALNRHFCDPEALHRRFAQMNHWPGSQRVHVVLHHMDGRAASVGESRSLYMMWRYQVPRPELQFDVYDGSGHLVATTDFVWHKYGKFGEFDGELKYNRLVRPGESPGDVVFREKKREDLVRRLTGYGGIRWVWSEVNRGRPTARRICRELGL